MALQKRRNAALVAEEEEAEVRMADCRQLRARNHHIGTAVAPHRVQRHGQMSFGLQDLDDAPRGSVPDAAHVTPPFPG